MRINIVGVVVEVQPQFCDANFIETATGETELRFQRYETVKPTSVEIHCYALRFR